MTPLKFSQWLALYTEWALPLLIMPAGTVWGRLEFVNACHIVRCSTSPLRALTTEPCRVPR